MLDYDYMIVGGGVSGLFAAMRLEKKLPHARLLLLEKNSYLGGRTRMDTFHSHKVVSGAGVGRYPKDRLLQQLVEQCQEIKPVESRICYQFSHPVYTLSFIENLKKKKKWIQTHRNTQTFRDFFLSFYSRETYDKFCESNGFTDFENADIVDTLYDYGFEDNIPGHSIFPVDWNRLVRHLRSQLQRTILRKNTEMLSFEKDADTSTFRVRVQSRRGIQVYCTHNIVFAGSIEKYPYPIVHQQIGFNSFLRMYTYSKPCNDPLHRGGMTYYDHTLQKSIYVSPRIRTVSYSDTNKADAVMRLPKAQVQTLAGYQYEDSVQYYWKHGTHFYRPLDPRFTSRNDFIRYAQNPEPHVFIVGECISQNQGWTEGALESVLAIEHLWKA